MQIGSGKEDPGIKERDMANESRNNNAMELSEEKLESVAGGAQSGEIEGRKETIFCPYHYTDCLCVTDNKKVSIEIPATTVDGLKFKGRVMAGVDHHRCLSCGRDFYGPFGNGTSYYLDGCRIVS